MNARQLALLKELSETHGAPGNEHAVREVIGKHLEGFTKITADRLGSIICEKTGDASGPRVMLPGHMDEIGFMVSAVTKHGFVKFAPLGGWWSQVMLAQKVRIETSKGPVVGITCSVPPHALSEEERKKPVDVKDMHVDVGAASQKEAAGKFGIRPGDTITPVFDFEVMKGRKMLLGKAWDDRVGCALFIDVLTRLKRIRHPNTVFGVGTVQEEVGLRGARTSAHVVNPDVCIVLEVGIADDVPGSKAEEKMGKLGAGPQITVLDHAMIPNRRLRDLAVETARRKKIPVQFQVLTRGATDGGVVHIHQAGVPTLYLGVPTRYIHSHAGIFHADDYDGAVKLLVELVRKLDAKTVKALTP
ncbi:MAG TPA: M42 family metallopeptidase [Planctomycetota bacterium]|nr:M42 family metallopeptidase [Planctomycetota bacterium]